MARLSDRIAALEINSNTQVTQWRTVYIETGFNEEETSVERKRALAIAKDKKANGAYEGGYIIINGVSPRDTITD